MTLQIFDHYSPQKHESVHKFLESWGEHPWNDMNVPVGLGLHETDDEHRRFADVLVLNPRKEHVKTVTIYIDSDEELEMLRTTFVGVAEALYGPAASNLEHFARGGMPKLEEGDPWGGLVLYYWEAEEFEEAK